VILDILGPGVWIIEFLILKECELFLKNFFKVFSKSCIVHDFFEVKGQFYQNSHAEHILLPGSRIFSSFLSNLLKIQFFIK